MSNDMHWRRRFRRMGNLPIFAPLYPGLQAPAGPALAAQALPHCFARKHHSEPRG